MGTPSPDLQFLLNFLVLIPVLIAMRWVVRSAAGVRSLMTLTGMLLVLAIAPRFLLFYLIYWATIFTIQFFVWPKNDKFFARQSMVIAVFIALSPLLIWKSLPVESIDWFSNSFNVWIWTLLPAFGAVDSLFQFIEPIGMSFTIFRAIDLIVKIRIGLLEPISLGRMYYFGFFPAILVVGPISEYEEIRIENQPGPPRAGDVIVGLVRMVIGGAKLFLIGPLLAPSFVIMTDFETLSVGIMWLGLIAYSWWFYINFSGFSDLSIGAARSLGFKLKENFNNPYFQASPQKFWANWHMSLTRFAQRNVYVLAGGFRQETQYFAIFATMMVIALWHSPDLVMVIFGCYHGAIMMAERFLEVRARKLKRKPSMAWPVLALKGVTTFVMVIISIPLLVLNHDKIVAFYLSLFGF